MPVPPPARPCPSRRRDRQGRPSIEARASGAETGLDRPTATYLRQRRIAVGGSIGYAVEKLTLQACVTRDVCERDCTGQDTRGVLRLVLPLHVAPPPLRAR